MSLPALAAFAITAIALTFLKRSPLRRLMEDVPNQRSLHGTIVPRIGGVGILLGVATAWGMVSPADRLLEIVAISYLLLFAVSFADDVRSMPIGARLVTHFLVAALWTYSIGGSPWWALAFGFLLLVWSINLYNFMDGSDGLAGGMTVIGFATYAVAAYLGRDVPMAALCGSVSAAALAFLLFNFHPASLFLGDSGSIPLGFLSAAMGWYGVSHELWPLSLPILTFFPFLFDATYTLVRRVIRGDRVWLPHREHLYQRVVRSGLGHRKVAIVSYTLMFCSAITGLLILRAGTMMHLIVVSVVTIGALMFATASDRRLKA